MVLPLLYGLGAKDYLEPKGFLLLTCQKCKIPGPFAVFDSKRKVTLYSIPTISVREQMVLECRSCTQRFAVPPEMRQEFLDQVLTEQELLARLRSTSLARLGGESTERTVLSDVAGRPGRRSGGDRGSVSAPGVEVPP